MRYRQLSSYVMPHWQLSEPMSYQFPKVKVVDVSVATNTIKTVLLFNKIPSAPLAPSSLVGPDLSTAFELHQLISTNGSQAVFITNKISSPTPQVGSTYDFKAWWTPEQLLITRKSGWQEEIYGVGESGHHDHCELCYCDLLSLSQDGKKSFRLSNEWVCATCYQRYIESGVYREA